MKIIGSALSILSFFLILFAFPTTSLAEPGFNLTDMTIYHGNNNTCVAEKNNMKITVYPCKVKDVDSVDITQYVDFSWKGGEDMNVDWFFAYDDLLEKFDIYLWKNKTVEDIEMATINETYNLTLNESGNITDYTASSLDECIIGNRWNSYARNVSYLNGSSKVFCFSDYGYLNPDQTIMWIFGNKDGHGIKTTENQKEGWKRYTNKIDLKINLLQNNWSLYKVMNATMKSNKTYKTKWVFTPFERQKQGKWRIFGKLTEDTVQEAINNNKYIFTDPWWNLTWKYRDCYNVSHSGSEILYNFTINITIDTESLISANKLDAQGKSLRTVWNETNEECNWEWDDYDNTFNSSQTTIWAKIPTLKQAEQTVCIYYDGDATGMDFANKSDGSMWNLTVYKAVYHFDFNGTYYVKDSAHNGSAISKQNLQCSGSNINLNGKWGEGINTTSRGDQTNWSCESVTTFPDPTVNDNITLSVWANINHVPRANKIWGATINLVSHERVIGLDYDGTWDAPWYQRFTYAIVPTNVQWIASDGINMTHENWATLTGRWNDSCIGLWENGTFQKSKCVGERVMADESDKIYVGRNLTGTIDEIRHGYFARSTEWMQAEFSFNAENLGEEISDVISPIITIASPLNDSYSSGDIWFNVTLNEAGSWCGVDYGYGNNSMTNSSGNWNYNNASMDDGTYNSIFYCNDTTGNMNTTNRWFSIDTTFPQITIIQPWNLTYNNNTIDFNITANEALSWAAVEILGYNNSLTNQSGQWQYFNNTLSDGSYQATFWFNDSVGNMNTTSRWFTIDTSAPQHENLTYPTTKGENYLWTVRINVTDLSNFTVEIDIDGSNNTMTQVGSTSGYEYTTTFSVPSDTSYSFTIWMNDTFSQMNSTTGSVLITDYELETPGGGPGSPSDFPVANETNQTNDTQTIILFSESEMILDSPQPRLQEIIGLLFSGNLYGITGVVIESMTDYYYRPWFDWWIFDVLLRRITLFVGLCLLFFAFVKYRKLANKRRRSIRILIYGLLLPIIALLISLLP